MYLLIPYSTIYDFLITRVNLRIPHPNPAVRVYKHPILGYKVRRLSTCGNFAEIRPLHRS